MGDKFGNGYFDETNTWNICIWGIETCLSRFEGHSNAFMQNDTTCGNFEGNYSLPSSILGNQGKIVNDGQMP